MKIQLHELMFKDIAEIQTTSLALLDGVSLYLVTFPEVERSQIL